MLTLEREAEAMLTWVRDVASPFGIWVLQTGNKMFSELKEPEKGALALVHKDDLTG